MFPIVRTFASQVNGKILTGHFFTLAMSLQLPEEFQVKEESTQIEFYCPVKITNEVKDAVIKMQFGEPSSVLIKPKPRAAKTFILTGGTPDKRREILLYILSHVNGEDGKPLFQHDGHMFPLWLLKFFSEKVTDDMTPDDLRKIEELQYDKWCKSLAKVGNPDVADINKCELIVGPQMASAIVVLFGDKESLQRFSLPGEERRGLLLRLPAQVVVGFQLVKSPLQYKLTFCDYGPHKAEEICHQLKDLAIPIIKKMEFLLLDIKETDPIEDKVFDEIFKDFDVSYVRLPQESEEFFDVGEEDIEDVPENEEDTVSTSLLIVKRNVSPEDIEAMRAKLQELFEKIRLFSCKKCGMFYCPTTDKDCFSYFHKGRQVEIIPGEMEMMDVDDDGQEVVYVKYTCCGEVVKDEPPVNCGRKENGEHEKDEEKGEVSSWSLKAVHITN